jgi:hypothetical protein
VKSNAELRPACNPDTPSEEPPSILDSEGAHLTQPGTKIKSKVNIRPALLPHSSLYWDKQFAQSSAKVAQK